MKKIGTKSFWIIFYVGTLLTLLVVSSIHINLGESRVYGEAAGDIGKEDVVIPADITAAIARLDAELDSESKSKLLNYNKPGIDLKDLSFDEFLDASSYITEGHLGVGASIRNSWGLWEGSRLKRWFLWRGITHSDDMSGFVMKEYIAHLEGGRFSNYNGRRVFVLLMLSAFVAFFCYVFFGIYRRVRKGRVGSGLKS